MFLLNKNVEKQKLISSYTCSAIRRIYCYTLKDCLVSRWFFCYNKFFLDHGSFRGIRESYELSEYSSMYTCTCKHLQQRVKGCGDFYAQQISQDVQSFFKYIARDDKIFTSLGSVLFTKRIEVQDYFVGMNIRPKVVDYSKNSRVRT